MQIRFTPASIPKVAGAAHSAYLIHPFVQVSLQDIIMYVALNHHPCMLCNNCFGPNIGESPGNYKKDSQCMVAAHSILGSQVCCAVLEWACV